MSLRREIGASLDRNLSLDEKTVARLMFDARHPWISRYFRWLSQAIRPWSRRSS